MASMAEATPPRHYNVASARRADLLGAAAVGFACCLFASLFINMVVEVLTADPGEVWALAALVGPIVFGLSYGALNAVRFAVRRIAARRPVDLDAPEIVIQRRPKHRLAATAGISIFFPVMVIFLLLSIDFATITPPTIIVILFGLVLLASVVLPILRRLWRPGIAYAPIVLGSDGLLDRSTDLPCIPWRDIVAVDSGWGVLTLTGETAQRPAPTPPNGGLLKRGMKPVQPKIVIASNGLEPDEFYARALIRAYWLRRRAEQAIR